ncbi:MAG: hypothetical protein HW419_1585 [Deltaproteobacteria bacterium]|nr:hypothetical protein [Deltaproteobacteria bacterium]
MISKGGFQTRPYETFVLFVSFVVKTDFPFSPKVPLGYALRDLTASQQQ